MNNLEKELIPYEQALELAKLNFNEKCFGYYGVENELHIEISSNLDTNLTRRNFIAAPTFSAAFRWFREKYELSCSIKLIDNSRHYYFDFTIYDSNNRDYNDEDCFDSCKRIYDDGKFDTYEEAELECLKNLIEIVKENEKNNENHK